MSREREPQKRVSVSMPADLVEWARQTAQDYDVSISVVYSDAVRGMRREIRRRQTMVALAMNEGVTAEGELELRREYNIPKDQNLREALLANERAAILVHLSPKSAGEVPHS